MRRFALVSLLALFGCADEFAGPASRSVPARRPSAAAVAGDPHGPPPPHAFGSDTYSVGQYTGRGTSRPGLSCSNKPSPDVRECTGFLPSAVDGALLDVTLQIPMRAPRPVPLVAVVHGYAGSKSSSGAIVTPLLADGYAVLRYSTRGFGQSWGQVNLVDVHAEVGDLRSMIAQVLDERAYQLDAGAVAVAGASYGGGHAWLAGLTPTFTSPGGKVVRIRTVVPIAAWSDLLYSLLPNGRERASVDVPGGTKLSFVNALYLSGVREDPSRPYPNYPEYLVGWHAWMNAQEPNDADPVYTRLADGLAGYRSVWWQQQFWQQAPASRLPVFVVQGFTDDLFPLPEAARMVRALRTLDPAYPVAAYLGDLGHPRASNKPGELDYVLGLLRRWLAYHVKGEGATPPNVVHAALTRPREEPFNPGNVVVVPTLDALSTGVVSKSFDGSALLVNPATDPSSGFAWDPLVMEGAGELRPLPPPPESPSVPGSLAVYEVPLAELSDGPLVVAGQPSVALRASTGAYRVQLNVRLFDVDGAGTRRLVTRGTYTLQSRTVGMPIGDVNVVIPTYGNFWRSEPGHTLRLELTNVDAPYVTPSRVPSATTVSAVRLDIPVRGGT